MLSITALGPSRRQIPQMRCERRMQHTVDLEASETVAQVLEQPPAATEQDRRKRDLELVHGPDLQVLLHHVGAAGNPHVLAAGCDFRLRERALRTVRDEMER